MTTVSATGIPALPYNSPSQLSSEEEQIDCDCEYHATIHPTSGVYPLCIYNDHPELFTDSKGSSSHSVMKGPDEHDKVTVMEDGNFCIVKDPEHDPNGYDKHESWIMHYCPSVYWKVYVEEHFMNTNGVCKHCYEVVPPGLIALWKLHNWQYIQETGFANDPPMTAFDTQLAELGLDAMASCA
jgi:hypothetical protein